MKKALIGIALLFVSQAFAQKNNISFNLMAFLNSNYSLSYYYSHSNDLNIGGSVHYSNPRYGFITWIGAPVDTIYDVSVSAGIEYFPLTNIRFLKGAMLGTRIELGYASIRLANPPVPDSSSATGLFLAPAVEAGYKIKTRHFFIMPLIGLIYNFSFIDYSNIGKFEDWNEWGFREEFPFHLTWDRLHNYRKGFRYQLGLKVGFTF